LAAVLFVASAIYLVKKRILFSCALVFAALFVAGALSIQLRRSSASEPSLWLGDGEALVTARVISEGDIQSEGSGSLRQRIDIETEKIESDAQTKVIAEGVRLSIYHTDRGNSRDTQNGMRLFSYGHAGVCPTE